MYVLSGCNEVIKMEFINCQAKEEKKNLPDDLSYTLAYLLRIWWNMRFHQCKFGRRYYPIGLFTGGRRDVAPAVADNEKIPLEVSVSCYVHPCCCTTEFSFNEFVGCRLCKPLNTEPKYWIV